MKTSTPCDLRKPCLASLPLALVAGATAVFTTGLSSRADAAIPVSATGSGIQAFPSAPAQGEWATMTWTGAAADITDATGLDAAVQLLDVASFTNALSGNATIPPAADARPRFNSTLLSAQFRPTAAVKGNVLVAKLQNTSGAAINEVEISYDFAKPVAGTESVPGLRVFYSLTGAPGSWTLIPGLSTGTPGKLNTGFALGSPWAVDAPLYVLWADDSSGTDDAYTIDNVNVRKAGEEAKVLSFGLPGNPATLTGKSINWYVPTGTDVTSLAPTFTLSHGATASPVSGTARDFTTPVTYTVTGANPAVNGTYTVTVATGTPPVPVPGNFGAADNAANFNLNAIVGSGNRGVLQGDVKLHWGSTWGSITVPVDTNGFLLQANTGGGNFNHNLSGPLSGDGSFQVFHGPHTNASYWNSIYTISGSSPNTYTGGTWIRQGNVRMNKGVGIDALPAGVIRVGDSSTTARLIWGASDQISDDAEVIVATSTVTSGATDDAKLNFLDLGGYSDSIKKLVLSGSKVRTGSGGILRVDTLVVNGVDMPRGGYGLSSGLVTGTGYIDVGDFGPPVELTPPEVPAGPVPAVAATAIHPARIAKLNWNDTPGANSYDLYLWEASEERPEEATAFSLTDSEFTLYQALLSTTDYKWQVVARNDAGETPGPEWNFSTLDRREISGDLDMTLDALVGAGPAELVGNASTYWNVVTSVVDINLNGHELTLHTGSGNAHIYNGAISGPGTLRFDGRPDASYTPDIQLGGSGANTPTSSIFRFGRVQLKKTAGVDALAGPLTVATTGTVRIQWLASDQINDNSSLDSSSSTGALHLELGGFSDTIGALTLKAGHTVNTGTGGVLTVSSLTVDGVPMTGGPFTSATHPGLVSGTGSLVIAAGSGSPFENWASAKGLSGAAADFDADPDHDGLSNGIEYVLGGEPNPAHPAADSSALLPYAYLEEGDFVFTYQRSNAAAHLNPTVEFDGDLQGTWTTAADPANATIEVFPGSPSASVVVRIPMGSNKLMFARLKVTEPAP